MAAIADLERLYDAHAQALYAFILNLTRNEADTRDILQEVFLRLARDPGIIRRARDERRFLLRTAHNCAVDHFRRREAGSRAQENLQQQMAGLFETAEDPDLNGFRKAAEKGLGKLPIDQRTVIHLRLWEDMTFQEISELLDISINTAASRYRYGIDKLRAELRPIYEEIL
jgi:RNA polymerase sigma-70 factor (ECF subfamily)